MITVLKIAIEFLWSSATFQIIFKKLIYTMTDGFFYKNYRLPELEEVSNKSSLPLRVMSRPFSGRLLVVSRHFPDRLLVITGPDGTSSCDVLDRLADHNVTSQAICRCL